MLSLAEIAQKIIENKRSKDLVRNDKVYYEMSLHIDGACPAYEDKRYGTMIYPTNYFGIEYQRIFETSLFSKFPFESEETRNYRMSQYRPQQQEPFLKAIQVIVGAIFQDGNYTVEIDNKRDSDYIWGENFEGKHLISWVSKYFSNICNDPNGYVVVIPKYSRAETKGDVEPVLWFIPSVDIIYVSDEDLLFKRGDDYWLINKIGYFRYRKDESNNPVLMDDGGYYAHMLNRLPFRIAGGIWNTQGFYNSWLYAAKAIADEFVGEKSLAQFVNKQNAHPFFIAADTECPDCHGAKDVQWCKKCNTDSTACNCDSGYENWTLSKCATCGGTGVNKHDPAKWMIVPSEQMDNDQIKIVSADTNIPKVQFENVKDVEKRIMRALHLNYIEESQSAVAKDKDMESRYQFLAQITNSLFDDHLYNAIKDITALRNVSVRNGVVTPKESPFTIIKPTQFAIMTATELKEEIGEVPDYVKSRQVEEYVDKKFGGDECIKRKSSLIVQMDKIAVSSDNKVQAMLLNGGIDRRDLQFHINLPLILDKIERDRGAKWLLNESYDNIKEEIDRIFAEIIPALPLNVDTSIRNMGLGIQDDEVV